MYFVTDEGDSLYLNRFPAPKRLGLKVGCPVMLVVNLRYNLLNGLIGHAFEIPTDDIQVYFYQKKGTVSICRHLFTKIDPDSKITLAKRLQFPLILAFGITIHISQGMDLHSVVVDCEDANITEQIGVAIGCSLCRSVASKKLQKAVGKRTPILSKNLLHCVLPLYMLQIGIPFSNGRARSVIII